MTRHWSIHKYYASFVFRLAACPSFLAEIGFVAYQLHVMPLEELPPVTRVAALGPHINIGTATAAFLFLERLGVINSLTASS